MTDDIIPAAAYSPTPNQLEQEEVKQEVIVEQPNTQQPTAAPIMAKKGATKSARME